MNKLALQTVSPQIAQDLLLSERAQTGTQVAGPVMLESPTLTYLPEDLHVKALTINNCPLLSQLPKGMRCYELIIKNTNISEIPEDIRVESLLEIEGCHALKHLPNRLKVKKLVISDCTCLEELPASLYVDELNIASCSSLTQWPKCGNERLSSINASNCRSLTYFPDYIKSVGQLNLLNCMDIVRLPENLLVTSWLELAYSGLTSLPLSMAKTALRWRGVRIDHRIAFDPDDITTTEILATLNIELRRVKLERMGLERFFAESNAEVIDKDFDPGGERRLMRVSMPGDEDLLCVSVTCPSTGRLYLIRVPPNMKSCRQAVAWIAGFDDERDYNPIMET